MKKEPADNRLVKTTNFELAVYARGDNDAEKVALVLPGRLDTKDYVHMTSLVDSLANDDLYALSFDPPGSWGSPGDIENYTTTTYLAAVKELIDYLGNKPTFLAGHSRGGATAALATQNNKCVSGVALIMSSYYEPTPPKPEEIKNGHHLSLRDLPPGNHKTDEKVRFDLPLAYFEDGKKYNSAVALQDYYGPKLLICGTQDEFFPPSAVKEEFDKLDEPKEFLELPTEHDYRLHAEMVDAVNHTVVNFVKTYIK